MSWLASAFRRPAAWHAQPSLRRGSALLKQAGLLDYLQNPPARHQDALLGAALGGLGGAAYGYVTAPPHLPADRPLLHKALLKLLSRAALPGEEEEDPLEPVRDRHMGALIYGLMGAGLGAAAAPLAGRELDLWTSRRHKALHDQHAWGEERAWRSRMPPELELEPEESWRNRSVRGSHYQMEDYPLWQRLLGNRPSGKYYQYQSGGEPTDAHFPDQLAPPLPWPLSRLYE